MDDRVELPEPVEFQHLLTAIGAAKAPATKLAVRALLAVRHAVITGEGPAAQGRVHFSRTLEVEDAALCARILTAAGGESGTPVSRVETDIMFDIHEAALERTDNGRFDDLLGKVVAHYLLAAAGRAVPARQLALAAATPLAAWARPADFEPVDRELAGWIAARLTRGRGMMAALDPVAAMLIGAGAVPLAMSIASLLDWAG